MSHSVDHVSPRPEVVDRTGHYVPLGRPGVGAPQGVEGTLCPTRSTIQRVGGGWRNGRWPQAVVARFGKPRPTAGRKRSRPQIAVVRRSLTAAPAARPGSGKAPHTRSPEPDRRARGQTGARQATTHSFAGACPPRPRPDRARRATTRCNSRCTAGPRTARRPAKAAFATPPTAYTRPPPQACRRPPGAIFRFTERFGALRQPQRGRFFPGSGNSCCRVGKSGVRWRQQRTGVAGLLPLRHFGPRTSGAQGIGFPRPL
jgi:hypothetical protein